MLQGQGVNLYNIYMIVIFIGICIMFAKWKKGRKLTFTLFKPIFTNMAQNGRILSRDSRCTSGDGRLGVSSLSGSIRGVSSHWEVLPAPDHCVESGHSEVSLISIQPTLGPQAEGTRQHQTAGIAGATVQDTTQVVHDQSLLEGHGASGQGRHHLEGQDTTQEPQRQPFPSPDTHLYDTDMTLYDGGLLHDLEDDLGTVPSTLSFL